MINEIHFTKDQAIKLFGGKDFLMRAMDITKMGLRAHPDLLSDATTKRLIGILFLMGKTEELMKIRLVRKVMGLK